MEQRPFMKTGALQDCWISGVLILFCGIMTWFLVRSEYFHISSTLHELPVRYVAERFLKYENSSSLKITWKGEDAGATIVRVIPGVRPIVTSSTQMTFPILGQKPRVYLEIKCRLKTNRDVSFLHAHGKIQELLFDVSADFDEDKIIFRATGNGIDEKGGFVLNDLTKNGGRKILEQIPGLPAQAVLPSPEAMFQMTDSWRMTAVSSQVYRLGDWMDAYVVEARMDGNSWFKLWMSPTGELLKMESSFGLNAINEDFFEGPTTDG